MAPPAAPLDSERLRLAALLSYGILDTPPEREFDELVARAARETGYPTALLSLMDETRCWFKATAGLKPADAHIRELPRPQTFCNHAFNSSGTFIVADAACDERFKELLVVDRPDGYRAYAGAQLITAEGHSLGTLCILDDRPREPTEAQRAVLRRLADEAMALLEMRRRRLGSPAAAPRPLALVVDDDRYVRIVAAEMMKHLGFEVLEADDGEAALDLFRTHGAAVRVVLSDLNMPRLNGLNLARELLAAPLPPTLVVMSGQFDPRARSALLAAGVTCLLTKPFTLDALRAALPRALTAR